MNNRNLQNEKLDKIGRNLLESAKIRDEAVEKIIAAPQLFNLVKARIESEKLQRKTKSSFLFPFWNWQRIGLSFGTLAILLFGTITIFVFANRDSSFQTAEIITPPIQSPNKFDELETKGLVVQNQFLAKRTTFKKAAPKPKKSTNKTNKEQIPQTNEDEERAFYPLTFTEDLETAQEDSQIIRVELPRSSLVALGVNPPKNNPVEMIKAELLVSSDGVTRGIRFIK